MLRHISYADALAKTASESIDAIVRKRRIYFVKKIQGRQPLFAGFVARMGEERLPQRVMFGELVGGIRATQGGKRKTGWLI